MKTIRILLFAMFAALLLSLPAWAGEDGAGEDEASDRFHDAYVQEVIEGKVATAARVYLELMEDEQVPARLRAESRFRFAICTVLLGRADEGRSQLTALADDAEAPAAVRKRAREYLATVADIGVGTELDKKLQSLVFDLGRRDPNYRDIPAYRDFEIIGKRAIPFLKKLRQHSDLNLRNHALRLLVRMKEPGMADLWSLEFSRANQSEFVEYLRTHPEERKRFEQRVMEMGTPAWQKVRYMPSGAIWSRDFVRAFAATKLMPGTAVGWLGYAHDLDDEDFDLLLAWMDGDDELLADAATDWILRYASKHERAGAALHQKILERLLERLGQEGVKISTEGLDQFQQFTARQSVETVLAGLERMVRTIESGSGVLKDHWSAATLIAPFAGAVLQKETSPEETKQLLGLLWRWAAIGQRSMEAARKAGHQGQVFHFGRLAGLMRDALKRLEEPDALAQVRRVFSDPKRAADPAWLNVLPKAIDVRTVRLQAEAMKVYAAGPRQKGFGDMHRALGRSQAQTPEMQQAADDARLDLLGVLDDGDLVHLFSNYFGLLGRLTAAQKQTALLRVLRAARALPDKRRDLLLNLLLSGNASWFEDVISPLALSKWDALDALERRHVLESALTMRKRGYSDSGLRKRVNDAVAAVLVPHLDEVEARRLFELVGDRKRYPIELWLPRVEVTSAHWMRRQLGQYHPQVADESTRRMTRDPAKITGPVLRFALTYASPALQQEVVDALLGSEDEARREMAVGMLEGDGKPASPEVIEALVAAEVKREPVDPVRLRRAGEMLLARRPTGKLFPVARLLLAATERDQILAGIRMADSLGSPDLVNDLRPHLESMDAAVRVQAKKAMAAINAVARVAAGLPPGEK